MGTWEGRPFSKLTGRNGEETGAANFSPSLKQCEGQAGISASSLDHSICLHICWKLEDEKPKPADPDNPFC